MTKESEKKHIVAVYGSLRREQYNYFNLGLDLQKYIGTFETEPIYSLYSAGAFPCLKKGGTTSVIMDVFKVDDRTLEDINSLEGFMEGIEATFYDREVIKTPFGEDAYYYIYVPSVKTMPKVKSGDWVNYCEQKSNVEISC